MKFTNFVVALVQECWASLAREWAIPIVFALTNMCYVDLSWDTVSVFTESFRVFNHDHVSVGVSLDLICDFTEEENICDFITFRGKGHMRSKLGFLLERIWKNLVSHFWSGFDKLAVVGPMLAQIRNLPFAPERSFLGSLNRRFWNDNSDDDLVIWTFLLSDISLHIFKLNEFELFSHSCG